MPIAQRPRQSGPKADLQRRRLLKLGLCTAIGLASGPGQILAAVPRRESRTLTLFNTHTSESVRAEYWADGSYLPQGLSQINQILRDHRSGEIHPIDVRLLDAIHELCASVPGPHECMQIISGYRSPETNARLRKASRNVAKRSFHMQGRAIDLRIPGIDLRRLRDLAIAMQSGGVGYYPRSDFIHIDTGPIRAW